MIRLKVWKCHIFDMFKEGYKIDESTLLPEALFEYIYVFENIYTIVPAVKFTFKDVAGAISDFRREGQLVAFTDAVEQDKARWFDFAILSQKVEDNTFFRHPATINKVYYGIDVLALWMMQEKSRSFGYISAGEVVKRIWNEVVGRYKKYGVDVEGRIEIGDGRVARRFVQVSDDVKFLRYLRSILGGIKNDGYLCWIDRGRKEVTLKFKSIKELKEQKVSKYFKVIVDPKELDKAYENGIIKEKEEKILPILYFQVDARNSGIFSYNPVWRVMQFDLGSNRFSVEEKKFMTVEKDAARSFVEKEWDKSWGKRVIAVKGYEELIRLLGILMEAKLKRRIWIWTVGNSELRLGEKVRLIMSTGYEGEIFHWLRGDWIVASIVHCISAPDYRYFMKVGLIGEEFGKGGKLI